MKKKRTAAYEALRITLRFYPWRITFLPGVDPKFLADMEPRERAAFVREYYRA
jgi:hypothetical protein